jgi:hypothetical protein
VPAATAWPIVLAFGLTLIFAGLVTAASVSILGVALSLTAAVGWFRNVLPAESYNWAPIEQQSASIVTTREKVGRIAKIPDFPRASLPLEIYPISAGVKGGLAGSVAMAVLAGVYGVLSGHGIWYPMNLLVAGFFPSVGSRNPEQLSIFTLHQFLLAVPLHLLISLLVGLLYGAILPMLPRRPVLLAGFLAPLLWSGVIYGILGFVNPVLNQRINWWWFVLSQLGFGIVAGLVVSREERVRTRQRLPFMVRAGIEAPGVINENEEAGPQ